MDGISVRPATKLLPITPSDSAALPVTVRALYIGGSGNVNLVDHAGANVLLSGMSAGVFHPVAATYVYDYLTTATGIVGVY